MSVEQIEKELRLAKEYYRRTIQPRIVGRRLRDVELFVAQDAYNRLQTAADEATKWNSTEAGKLSPSSPQSLAELHSAEFHPPKEQLYFDENLKPESLALIAASLMNAHEASPAPDAAIRSAHELLATAEEYLMSLPKRELGFKASFRSAFSTVTFKAIAASNEKDSGCLPLLPPAQGGRNEGLLSAAAFKSAVEKFLKQHTPRVTEEEWNREQEQNEMLAKAGQLIRPMGGRPQTYQIAGNRDTPVVFVTSYTDFKSREQSNACGSSDYVTKPFLFQELNVKALTFALRGRLQKRDELEPAV